MEALENQPPKRRPHHLPLGFEKRAPFAHYPSRMLAPHVAGYALYPQRAIDYRTYAGYRRTYPRKDPVYDYESSVFLRAESFMAIEAAWQKHVVPAMETYMACTFASFKPQLGCFLPPFPYAMPEDVAKAFRVAFEEALPPGTPCWVWCMNDNAGSGYVETILLHARSGVHEFPPDLRVGAKAPDRSSYTWVNCDIQNLALMDGSDTYWRPMLPDDLLIESQSTLNTKSARKRYAELLEDEEIIPLPRRSRRLLGLEAL